MVPAVDPEVVRVPALAPLCHGLGAPGGKLQILKGPCNWAPISATVCEHSCWHRDPAGDTPVCNPRDPERALYLLEPPHSHNLTAVLRVRGPSRRQSHLHPQRASRTIQFHHSHNVLAELPAQEPSRRPSCLHSQRSAKALSSVPAPTGHSLQTAL